MDEKVVDLRVFTEGERVEKVVPKTYLRLERKPGGCVEVIACNAESGRECLSGKLISFLPNGKIKIWSSVSEKLGFQRDAVTGKIMINKDR